MKLIIFGATGGTGRQLLEQALAEGHVVTAFVRNPSKLGLTAPNLRVVAGDVMDPAAVEQAMPGHDAVLVALGAPARSKGPIRSEGTGNIIRAMEKCGVRRLICQTSLGYAEAGKCSNGRRSISDTSWGRSFCAGSLPIMNGRRI